MAAPLEGDWQLKEDDIPISAYDFLFHVQDRNPRTPITTAVLSVDNLTTVLLRIGTETGRLLQKPVRIVPNSAFFSYISTVLQETPNYAEVRRRVEQVNDRIVEHEASVHYYSIRRRQLYIKWFIEKDQPVTISHPIDTHGRRRLDNQTTGIYAISNPNRRQWQRFNQEQFRF